MRDRKNIRKMGKQNLQKSTGQLGWDELRTVLAVARAGSLAGAARVLGLQHSTVFRRIEEMEQRLGTRLFDRTRSGWTANAQGEAVSRAAEAMEQAALTAEREILGADMRLQGVVRLATSELLATHLLPPLAARFLSDNAEVEIEVDASNRNLDLTRREADLALRATMQPPDSLVGRRVAVMRYAVFASPTLLPANSEAPKLQTLPWVGFDERISHFQIARWFRETLPDASPRFRADSIPTLMKAAVAGVGAAILPLFAGVQEPGLVRITPPIEGPEMALWVLSHPDVRGNARVRALAQFLTEAVPLELERLEAMTTTCSGLAQCPKPPRRGRRASG